MKDPKMYVKHERSDAKLGTGVVRLDVQSMTHPSLICEAKSAREVGEEWRRG